MFASQRSLRKTVLLAYFHLTLKTDRFELARLRGGRADRYMLRGLSKAWRRMQERSSETVSPKAERAITAIEAALEDFPLLDPKVSPLLPSMPPDPTSTTGGPIHPLLDRMSECQ